MGHATNQSGKGGLQVVAEYSVKYSNETYI
jgi:hypothetical protein